MISTDGDRIERAIETMRADISIVRELVASLAARLDHAAAMAGEVAQLRQGLFEHERHDAEIQTELRAHVRWLWAGVGVVGTAFVGAFTTWLIGRLG